LDELTSALKPEPEPVTIVLSMASLYEQRIDKIIEEQIKPEIIRRTQHMYRSLRHMRTTGLASETIKKHTSPEGWMRKTSNHSR
jgi:hypothetical protein